MILEIPHVFLRAKFFSALDLNKFPKNLKIEYNPAFLSMSPASLLIGFWLIQYDGSAVGADEAEPHAMRYKREPCNEKR